MAGRKEASGSGFLNPCAALVCALGQEVGQGGAVVDAQGRIYSSATRPPGATTCRRLVTIEAGKDGVMMKLMEEDARGEVDASGDMAGGAQRGGSLWLYFLCQSGD